MRSLILVAALVLVPSALIAQTGDPSRNYDFQKPMYTMVDVATKGWFSGWSGNCNSGRIPMAFSLWRIDPITLTGSVVPATLSTGPRPDAAAWLATTCGRPFDQNIGWSLVPKNPEPAGRFLYVVLVTDVPASWTCGVYPADYPSAGQMWCDYVANQVVRVVQ